MARRVEIGLVALLLLAGCTSGTDAGSANSDPGVVAGGLTAVQVNRSGVDASADCNSETARTFIREGLSAQTADFLAGYKTDEEGQQAWAAEASGAPEQDPDLGRYQQLPPASPREYALCWWRGSFTVSSGVGERTRSDIVVLHPLDDPPMDPIVVVDRNGPIPVWPPPNAP